MEKKNSTKKINSSSLVEKFPRFNMSIKDFFVLKERGLLRFDLAYQRGERMAWRKPEHVEAMLDTIFKGYPFPSIYLVKINKIWYVMDGQQRLTTAFAIRQGDCVSLPLSSEHTIFDEKFASVAGNPFWAWVGGFRDAFDNYKFNCIDCSAMDDDEQAIYFARLNGGGVKLTYAESQKGKYHKTWSKFQKVLDHAFWKKYDVKNQDRDVVLMQLVNSIVCGESVNHISKDLVAWFIDWVYDDAVCNSIIEALDSLVKVFSVELECDDDCKIIRQACKKIHLESLLYALISEKPKQGWDYEAVNNNLVTFLRQKSVKGFDGRGSERIKYNDFVSSNTACNPSVWGRHIIINAVLGGTFEKPKKPYIEKVEPEKVEPEKVEPEKSKEKKGKSLSEKQKEKAHKLAEVTYKKLHASDSLDGDIVSEVAEVAEILKK